MKTARIENSGPRYFQFSWLAACFFMGLGAVGLSTFFFKLARLDAICVGVLVTFTLLCSVQSYKLVQQRSQLVFTPMPWLLLSSGAYFGFGPLVYFFGAAEAKDFCQQIYLVTTQDILRVTLVNVVGVTLVFGVWWWRVKKLVYMKTKLVNQEATIVPIFVFYLIGLGPRCLILLSGLGLVHFIAPGFLTWLAVFTSAGLMFLTTTALRRGGAWWLLFVVLLALDVATAMTTFSKFAILLAVLPCFFGYLVYRPGVKSLRWIIVFLFAVYLASNSYVTYCRSHGLGIQNNLSSRVGLARSYFDHNDKLEAKIDEETQNWWSRLNYANAQTFAMKEYDQGYPGNSFAQSWMVPIPRILWPDKPVIEAGAGFYEKLTNEKNASFGIGFFAEGYWNGGWLYVILGSMVIGWVFGTVTLLVIKEQAIGNTWILPIALLWIKNGGRADGWINVEIVGPAVYTLIYVGLMRVFLPTPTPARSR